MPVNDSWYLTEGVTGLGFFADDVTSSCAPGGTVEVSSKNNGYPHLRLILDRESGYLFGIDACEVVVHNGYAQAKPEDVLKRCVDRTILLDLSDGPLNLESGPGAEGCVQWSGSTDGAMVLLNIPTRVYGQLHLPDNPKLHAVVGLHVNEDTIRRVAGDRFKDYLRRGNEQPAQQLRQVA